MNNSILRQYFPVIRTRNEVMNEILQKPLLETAFKSWNPAQQEEFLNFCTGMKGCKVLYDSFFKHIMNPETHPERLERFLSLLLHKNVKILQVLPNESRMTVQDSLLIMDMVVEMEDGSIANVEMQKISYAFPGQRSSCYSADLLLRQYQRVKQDLSAKNARFSYRYIKDVYTIVLFENSPAECKALPEEYLHYGCVRFDTGLEVEMPQKFIYVPLDIYREILHNRGIKSDIDAWLTFLCEDDPEIIVMLIGQYPGFRPLYDDIYRLCENMEDIMGYFSEALQEMDKNTVQYMIEEQQSKIEEQQETIEEQQGTIEKQQEVAQAAIERMLSSGRFSAEEIAEYQGVSVEKVRELAAKYV